MEENDPALALAAGGDQRRAVGQRKRIGLAQALINDPDLVILDEPTSGLDLLTRRDFLASMVDLAANGRTLLISSHGISELERRAPTTSAIWEG